MPLFQKAAKRKNLTDFSSIDLRKDEQTIHFIGERWDTRQMRRSRLHERWTLNIAMYVGAQYHQYDRNSRRLTLPTSPHYQRRYMANRLMNIPRKILSKYMAQQPGWVSRPGSNDNEDLIKSRLSSKALRGYWRLLRMNKTLSTFVTWLGVTGSSFMRTYWDANAGEPINFNPEDLSGRAPRDEDADDEESIRREGMEFLLSIGLSKKEAAAGLRLMTGDVRVETVNPFEMDPDDDGHEEWRDIRFNIHSKARSPSWVKDVYGVDVKPESKIRDLGSSMFEAQLDNITGVGNSSQNDLDEPKLVVHQIWANPQKRYPKGYFAVVAGAKVLRKGNNPYFFNDIPYEMAIEIPVPGRLWGMSSLEQAIPVQVEYNKGRSLDIQSRDAHANIKWLVAKGHGIMSGSLTNATDEVVQYNFPYKPERDKPPELPQYTRQMQDQALRDFEDVTNLHEATNARMPQGARSGIAVRALQEQDDTMLGPSFLTITEALSSIGSKVNQLIAQNVSEERLMTMFGKDSEMDIIKFKGKDLFSQGKRSSVNYFDVEVQMGSQLPMSKAQQQDLVVQLLQFKLFDPVADRDKIFELLELGKDPLVLDMRQLDVNEQRMENQRLLEGTLIEVFAWNDHAVHLDEMRRFQKQPDFRKFLEKMPPPERIRILKAFDFHGQKHTVQLQAQIQAAQGPEEQGPQGAAPPPQAAPELPPELPPEGGAAPDEQALLEILAQRQNGNGNL